MRCIITTAVVVLCIPAGASAQLMHSNVIGQTTDSIIWPALGTYPAYPPEPDERPWLFSVSGGLYHDSNLFKLSDSVDAQTVLGTSDKSDNIARLGVGLKGNIPVSQQRLLLNLEVDGYKFDRFSTLDHVAYNANATWKWQITSLWSGDLGYSRQSLLAPFSEVQAPIKDTIILDHAFGNAAYMMTSRWRVRGGLDWYRYNHSDVTFASANNETSSITAGVDYVTPAADFVGGQVKYTDGHYPNPQLVAGTLVDNQFKELETSLVAHWIVSGVSTLDARAGYTSRRHSEAPDRDFSGFTGRVSYDWTPAGKTVLNFSAWREIVAYQYIFANFVLSKGVSFGPNWAPTAKIVVQPKLLYEQRSFEGNPGFVQGAGPQTEDTFRGASLAIGYTPRRYLQFALGAQTGRRSSNTFGRDFDYTSVYANAKFLF